MEDDYYTNRSAVWRQYEDDIDEPMHMPQIVTYTSLPHAVAPPKYASDGAAGADLYATREGQIMPGERSNPVATGVQIAIPPGFYGQIAPRSGLARSHGISVLGGVIDSDYRGEVFVILQNNGQGLFTFARGDRIAQLIIIPCARVRFVATPALKHTDRGAGAFGSTGVH